MGNDFYAEIIRLGGLESSLDDLLDGTCTPAVESEIQSVAEKFEKKTQDVWDALIEHRLAEAENANAENELRYGNQNEYGEQRVGGE